MAKVPKVMKVSKVVKLLKLVKELKLEKMVVQLVLYPEKLVYLVKKVNMVKTVKVVRIVLKSLYHQSSISGEHEIPRRETSPGLTLTHHFTVMKGGRRRRVATESVW